MHKVKLHQTAFMANRVKWKRCKLQVIVFFFSARFGEKNSSLDIVKTFNDQLHLKTWYEVFLWTTTFYMRKHSQINTMTTRTTNSCGHSWHVVPVDLVPSRANPPGGAYMLLCSKLPKPWGSWRSGIRTCLCVALWTKIFSFQRIGWNPVDHWCFG